MSLASVKSRLVLPFWYRLTRVVPEKGPLNMCVCRKMFCKWRPQLDSGVEALYPQALCPSGGTRRPVGQRPRRGARRRAPVAPRLGSALGARPAAESGRGDPARRRAAAVDARTAGGRRLQSTRPRTLLERRRRQLHRPHAERGTTPERAASVTSSATD